MKLARFIRIKLLFVLLFFGLFAQAQDSLMVSQTKDSLFQKVRTFDCKVKLFTTDKLRNVFVVTPQNELLKFNAKGTNTFRFSNNRLGEITFIDATNPFNILLFYADYLTIVTVDRTLSPTGEFNLYDLDIVEVKCTAMSNDNNIWIYDDVSFRLKKISRDMEVIWESDNLSMLFEEELHPNFMLEKDNWLYVNNPTSGIWVFDNFGRYLKTIPIKNLTNFQVLDQQLLYREDGQLKAFHLESLSINNIAFSNQFDLKHELNIQKDFLYLLRDEDLSVYKY